jgi:hypothetical protein
MNSKIIRIYDNVVTMGVGDYIRILDTVYQISAVNIDGTLVMNKAFNGGFSDIIKAHYVDKTKLAAGLSYQATSADVQNYIHSQLSYLYPLYSTTVTVNRVTQTMGYTTIGYSWLVTFQGQMFMGKVDPLVVISPLDSSLTHPSSAVFQTAQGTTNNVAITVQTLTESTSIAPGDAIFVNVLAINDVGIATSWNQRAVLLQTAVILSDLLFLVLHLAFLSMFKFGLYQDLLVPL